jgi:3-phosphoshikimate 1-carboxyvinyltransferase
VVSAPASDLRSPPWPAPVARGAVDASVTVPGSKSQTNRALVIASLAQTPTHLVGPLQARDTALMVDALRRMGARIDDTTQDGAAPAGWTIHPAPLCGDTAIDCGLAGTVMRFVPPLAALATGPVAFDGDPRARERPMGPLIDGLRDLGVVVTTAGADALPFTVHGAGRVAGGSLRIDASGSSQFVSALLLAACRFEQGLQLSVVGRAPSQPHITMTLKMLAAAGVVTRTGDSGSWVVEPGVPRGGDAAVAPDLSNAMPFLAAALLTGGTMRIPRWASADTQPGPQILAVLEAFGATSTFDDDILVCTGPGTINGTDLDLGDVPELVTTVAVLATLATSPSTLRGVAHVRGHETDRLQALTDELNALGGDVEQTDDGLHIRPRPLHGGTFHTYADHRLATAAAVLGLVVPGIDVEDVATTDKTLPRFVELWTAMLASSSA